MKISDEVVGNETRVKVVKNKLRHLSDKPNFKFCMQGIHRTGEILELGVEQNLVEKSGAWYSITVNALVKDAKMRLTFWIINLS